MVIKKIKKINSKKNWLTKKKKKNKLARQKKVKFFKDKKSKKT
jgi:hypothetical protein